MIIWLSRTIAKNNHRSFKYCSENPDWKRFSSLKSERTTTTIYVYPVGITAASLTPKMAGRSIFVLIPADMKPTELEKSLRVNFSESFTNIRDHDFRGRKKPGRPRSINKQNHLACSSQTLLYVTHGTASRCITALCTILLTQPYFQSWKSNFFEQIDKLYFFDAITDVSNIS